MSNQKYIVVFKEDATQEQIDQYVAEVKDNGGNVTNKYDAVLKGFAAVLPDSLLANFQQDLSGDNSPIDYIEPDGIVTTQQQ